MFVVPLTDSVRTAQKTDGGGEDDVIVNEVNGDTSAEKVVNQEEAMEEGGLRTVTCEQF